MWIRKCSHISPFFTWPSAIFPSLHHGPKNLQTIMTTSHACGSPMCNMLSHPNRSVEAMWSVMPWGNVYCLELPGNILNSWEFRQKWAINNCKWKLFPAANCYWEGAALWQWCGHLQGQEFCSRWSDNVMWHTVRVLQSYSHLALRQQWYHSSCLGPQRRAAVHS